MSERILRDAYNQSRAGNLERNHSHLDVIRRQLFLAEKGAVSDALRKRIVHSSLYQNACINSAALKCHHTNIFTSKPTSKDVAVLRLFGEIN